MKKLLLCLFSFCTIQADAQDTAFQVKQIDSLVFVINHANLYTRRDSTVQDMPGLKLYIKTYLTTVMDGLELKKYVTSGRTTMEENGIRKQLITTSAFYYHEGRLIKVEEFAADSSHEQEFVWYYADNKPLYHTSIPVIPSKPGKLEKRAGFLLLLSQTIKMDIDSKLPK